MYKRKTLIGKLFLKFTNKTKYKQYKWEYKNYLLKEFSSFLTGDNKLNTADKIIKFCLSHNELNINHSGNIGDIVYALPTIKRIYELTGAAINLYLKTGMPNLFPEFMSHPLGNQRLNQEMVYMITPLIAEQGYVKKCEVYNGQDIQIDLDFFRSNIIPANNTNIGRWCGYVTGVSPQLHKSWLKVSPNQHYSDKIVVARSSRYRNTNIDYSFLKKYDNLAFVGVSSEFHDMRKSIPNIEWVEADDFLKLAQVIAGCKFFIGNQSFPYSIAEGLKIPRILEACYKINNVIPEGENAYDFFFQEHFQSLVEELAR